MQVTHVNDHATHAVIGGGKAIEFGISSSAEFYNILSSTLYKDQILAVVREGLCNAWDAHIEAGTTHIPIAITINEDSMVIKDAGKGIHKDDIGPIYCVYGNSTKKNDGMQTGGFGLGCKSPYAYVEHFEVISCHDGVQTIWNMSKASPKTGKPGAVPIASFPTQDTGLQVTVRIKNHTDRLRFLNLVKRIVFNGGMNATLNGDKLPTIAFDVSKSNYVLTTMKELLDTQTRVMVRYGNVIYPVDRANEIGELYDKVLNHLNYIGDHYTSYHIILQAPPHSIAVTPSRETLSMQEHTIATLNNLFAGFMKQVTNGFDKQCQIESKGFIASAVAQCKVDVLLKGDHALPGAKQDFRPVFISDLEMMARRLMSSKYPDKLEFRKWDIRERLTGMSQAGLLDRGTVQSYLSFMGQVQKDHRQHFSASEKYAGGSWLVRHVIAPLMVKLVEAKMPTHALSVYDPDDLAHERSGSKMTYLIPAMSARPAHHFKQLPYLRNIVVLSCSRMNVTDRLYHKHPVFKEMGSYAGFLFYHVGLKKADKEAARAFWAKSGMTVVDIIDRQAYEPEPARSEYVPAAKREKKVGLPKLAVIRDTKHGGLNIRLWRQEDVERIEHPECVVQLAINKGAPENSFGSFDREASKLVVQLFGDVCGVAPASNVLTQYHKKGIPHLETFVQTKLTEALTTRPSIQQYFAFSIERVLDVYGLEDAQAELMTAIYATPELRKEFGIINNLSDEDRLYLALYEAKQSRYYHRENDWMRELKNQIDKIELDPANLKLVERIKNNALVGIFSQGGLKEVFTGTNLNPAEKKKVIDAILTILN
jgi:hypothetical protein